MSHLNISVIVADARFLFRRGLCALLSGEPGIHVVSGASNAEETLARVDALAPDMLLVSTDLLDPEFQLIAALARRRPSTRIVLLAPAGDHSAMRAVIQPGVTGWLPRDGSTAELLKGIRQLVTSGSDAVPPGYATPASSEVPLCDAWTVHAALTRREQEILEQLLIVGNVRQIAANLSVSIKTVEAHKFNLMRKLDVHNRGDLIKLALRQQIASYIRHPASPEQESMGPVQS